MKTAKNVKVIPTSTNQEIKPMKDDELRELETKLVQVNLAALTRVEWSALVRVPRGADLQEVTDRFYDYLEGSEFTSDPHFWEKGDCWADDVIAVRDPADGPGFSMNEGYQIRIEKEEE